MDAFRCLIDSFPAGYQLFTVTVFCILGRIDLFVHHAVDFLPAAVAYIRRFIKPFAQLRLVFLTDIAASVLPAHPANIVTLLIAADVFQAAGGMFVRIRLTGNVSV